MAQPGMHWLCQHLPMSPSLMLPPLGGFRSGCGVAHFNKLWIHADAIACLNPALSGKLWCDTLAGIRALFTQLNSTGTLFVFAPPAVVFPHSSKEVAHTQLYHTQTEPLGHTDHGEETRAKPTQRNSRTEQRERHLHGDGGNINASYLAWRHTWRAGACKDATEPPIRCTSSPASNPALTSRGLPDQQNRGHNRRRRKQ